MNIYVGNLSENVNENDLRNAFENFGTVREVRLIVARATGQSRGYGFVQMPQKNEAEQAINEMNGEDFMGSTLNIDEAKVKARRTSQGRGGNSSKRNKRY